MKLLHHTGSDGIAATIATHIGIAVGTVVMSVHALINAARDQTAAEPATRRRRE